MNLKELREASGMSRSRFAEYFGIPYRTVQSWEVESESNRRQCPEYLLELMKYKLENEGFIREKEYVRIPQKALDAERDPEKAKAHIKKLIKMQEKIARKAADAEANAMTLEIKKHFDENK